MLIGKPIVENTRKSPVRRVRSDREANSKIEGAQSVSPSVSLTISLKEAVRAAEREGLSHMDAIKRVAKERGLGKRDVYRMVETATPEPGKSQRS